MSDDINIFVLTFNQMINFEYDENLYKPLICGQSDFNAQNYLRDDAGDNISHLNKYYSELTGQYWAWKNTNQDIIGFCQYRRWFAKNLRWEQLSKLDIENDLKEYDIILPHRLNTRQSLYEFQKSLNKWNPEYDVLYGDYVKLGEVLEEYFSDYADYYEKVMNSKILWTNNMFICRRKLADDYLGWLFDVLDKFNRELDLSNYDSRDTRIFGFVAERLLTTYVLKNNLKIKEYPVYSTERKFPILQVLYARIPLLLSLENAISILMRKL